MFLRTKRKAKEIYDESRLSELIISTAEVKDTIFIKEKTNSPKKALAEVKKMEEPLDQESQSSDNSEDEQKQESKLSQRLKTVRQEQFFLLARIKQLILDYEFDLNGGGEVVTISDRQLFEDVDDEIVCKSSWNVVSKSAKKVFDIVLKHEENLKKGNHEYLDGAEAFIERHVLNAITDEKGQPKKSSYFSTLLGARTSSTTTLYTQLYDLFLPTKKSRLAGKDPLVKITGLIFKSDVKLNGGGKVVAISDRQFIKDTDVAIPKSLKNRVSTSAKKAFDVIYEYENKPYHKLGAESRVYRQILEAITDDSGKPKKGRTGYCARLWGVRTLSTATLYQQIYDLVPEEHRKRYAQSIQQRHSHSDKRHAKYSRST